MFDFANQGYTRLIVLVVFGNLFAPARIGRAGASAMA